MAKTPAKKTTAPKATGVKRQQRSPGYMAFGGNLVDKDAQPAPPVRPGSAAAEKHERRDPNSIPSKGAVGAAKLDDKTPAATKPGKAPAAGAAYSAKGEPTFELPFDDAQAQSILGELRKAYEDALHQGGPALIDAYLEAQTIHDDEQGDDAAKKKFRYGFGFAGSIQRKETPGSFIVTIDLGVNVKRHFSSSRNVNDPRASELAKAAKKAQIDNAPMMGKRNAEVPTLDAEPDEVIDLTKKK